MLRRTLAVATFPALLSLTSACGDDTPASADTGVADTAMADSATDDTISTADVANDDVAGGDDTTTTPDLMAPGDTQPSDDTSTPAVEAFEPGPWAVLRAPGGEAVELVELVALPADMPAAEARAAFLAHVTTTATSLTVETATGSVSHALESARVEGVSHALVGFGSDGSVTSVTPHAEGATAKGMPVRFGQCFIYSAVTASYRVAKDPDDGTGTFIIDPATDQRVRVGPVASGTPPEVVGTFRTSDGQHYAIASGTTGFSVTWPNATTLLMPASPDGRAASAIIRLDAGDGPESGTSATTAFLRVLPATTLRDVLGGPSTLQAFLVERTELGTAGAPGRTTIGIQRMNLADASPADDSFVWKCTDNCLEQLDEASLCGAADHLRGRDPQDTDRPELALVGRFNGTLDFGGDIVLTTDGGTSGLPVEDSFVVVFDGDGNPRIGRKGGGMSVERVGFSPEGDVILTGTFAGAAGLGMGATAVGTRDVFVGTFAKENLEPVVSATFGTSDRATSLASGTLELETGGTCTASGGIVGFALRTNDALQFAGLGGNGTACVGEPMAVAEGADVKVLAAPGGGHFFWLTGGAGLPYADGGEPGTWPPVSDWSAAAGGSRARIMNNAR